MTACFYIILFVPFLIIATVPQLTFGTGENNSCPSFPWQKLRLPTTIVPENYTLTIHPNLNDFTFSGNVKIVVKVKKSTKIIILNQNQIVVTVKSIKTKNGRVIKVKNNKNCSALQQMSIELENSLRVGDEVILVLDFHGQIQKDLKGLYRSDYKMKNGTILPAVVTQFQPSDARKMLPCFDEPQLKATFQVSIIREKKHQALGNMPLFKTELYDESNNLVKDTFGNSVKMSTYLLAITVGTYENVTTKTNSGVNITVHANPEQIHLGKYPLETGKKLLEFYEGYFKISYPLLKQDMVSVTDFAAGAMENWGLITYRDNLLLLDPKKAGIEQEEFVVKVISHELGHQWFGNLVTMKWWNDLWLNEGFATLTEYYATGKIKPEWNFMDFFYLYVVLPAMRPDSFASTHPVAVSQIEDPDEIMSAFDIISYYKGGSIVNMFMQIAGEKDFSRALEIYLKKFEYDNADGEDLWNIIGNHVPNFHDVDLPSVAKSWTTKAGYPLITASLNPEKSQLTVQQERFFILQKQQENKNQSSTWPVPLTYKTDKNPSSKMHWLNSGVVADNISLQETPTWVKLNTDGHNFYRVLYDKNMYKRLSDQLNSDPSVFSTKDRASLLSDAFVLARAGLLDIEVPLKMLGYIRNGKETDYIPLKIVFDHLEQLDRTFWEMNFYETLEKFQRSFIKPFYDKTSWDLQEDNKKRHLQSAVINFACRVKLDSCVKKANEEFNAWVLEPTKVIQQDLWFTIIKTGIRYANYTVWQKLFNRYMKSTVPSERVGYLEALGQSRNYSIIADYLKLSLEEDKIKPSLIFMVIRSTTQNLISNFVTWQFMKKNWEKLYSLIGKSVMLGFSIMVTTQGFSTHSKYEEIKKFFDGKDLGPSQIYLKKGLDSLELRIQEKKIYSEKLHNWLKEWEKQEMLLVPKSSLLMLQEYLSKSLTEVKWMLKNGTMVKKSQVKKNKKK